MAETIRGLTVEISADATSFQKQMSALRRETASSGKELNALKRELELDFDPSKLSRAQAVAQRAIDETGERAELLRRRLSYLEESGNADTTQYRKIQAELAQTEAEAARLRAELERLDGLRFEKLGRSLTEAGNTVAGVGEKLTAVSVAATAAIGALGALGAKSISEADDIATLATQYDLSTDALQRFRYVALQTDTDAETLYKSFVKMRAAMADLSTGASSQAATALSALGLSMETLDGSEEQFYTILTTLSDMEDRTRMVALANDLFGERIADKLLPMLAAGSEAIAGYCAEFESLGALSEEGVSALADFDNVLNTVKTQLSNVALTVGASLLPIMERLAGFVSDTVIPTLSELAAWAETLDAREQGMILSALAIGAALGPVTIGLGKIITMAGELVALLPSLVGGLETLGKNKVVIIIAVIAAALALLFAASEQFRTGVIALVSTVADALAPVLSLLTGLFEGILSALTPLLMVVGEAVGELLSVLLKALSPILNLLTGLLDSLMPPLLTLVGSLLGVLDPVIAVLSALLSVVVGLLSGVLEPVTAVVATLLGLLTPILEAVLIPLTVYLNLLQIPIGLLCGLLGVLASGIEWVTEKLLALVGYLSSVLDGALDFAAEKINGVIDLVNDLIACVNEALRAVGLEELEAVGHVRWTTDTEPLPTLAAQSTAALRGEPYARPEEPWQTDTTRFVTAGGGDYSTHTTTQNVTVVIENHSDRVDVEDLVRQINQKLAEAM